MNVCFSADDDGEEPVATGMDEEDDEDEDEEFKEAGSSDEEGEEDPSAPSNVDPMGIEARRLGCFNSHMQSSRPGPSSLRV